MLVPSKAIASGVVPTGKVPSGVPVGDSFVTLLLPPFATHMLVPSNASAVGLVPTAKVPSLAPKGESSVTLAPSITHMLVPSNAICPGLLTTENSPRGPQAAAEWGVRMLLQVPAERDATGARGARHSATGVGMLQSPVAQSLFWAQVVLQAVPSELHTYGAQELGEPALHVPVPSHVLAEACTASEHDPGAQTVPAAQSSHAPA